MDKYINRALVLLNNKNVIYIIIFNIVPRECVTISSKSTDINVVFMLITLWYSHVKPN